VTTFSWFALTARQELVFDAVTDLPEFGAIGIDELTVIMPLPGKARLTVAGKSITVHGPGFEQVPDSVITGCIPDPRATVVMARFTCSVRRSSAAPSHQLFVAFIE
jgi:hypothetical protein